VQLPTQVDYPIVAVGDVHGQLAFLQRLLARLEVLPEWPHCTLVFVGDYLDRGNDIPGTLDLLLRLIGEGRAAAVMGNHDLAPVRAAGLDGRPPSAYWIAHYRDAYDYEKTFRAYLGRDPRYDVWQGELAELARRMPERHRDFLVSLPWLVEAPGHLFLHCGLSPELQESAAEQLRALRERRWDDSLHPLPGTRTADLWQTEYAVWLGADKRLAERPLAVPGKVQVTGHVPVPRPEADAVRIRLDTSGGRAEPLTGCLLRSATAAPVFIPSA
jgi:serine/threonine protein phosphatase 1